MHTGLPPGHQVSKLGNARWISLPPTVESGILYSVLYSRYMSEGSVLQLEKRTSGLALQARQQSVHGEVC